ncbi:type IV secretion system protein [Treponema zuelzerae]|uniref:Type IV secretion system protein n=1 Tax=Teretinema zuelzerae TaxID=156 RepID=A0AAE3EHC5_9SPIR|nr:type IV secretion system protein [Teretinema zuelzerae]MCD1653524.1 type IV secretion system protein [Teretinema zuelzerae]
MEPKWLDAPFFTLLEDFSSLQGYFMGQAMFIAKIILTLNLGLIAIKYIAKGEGLSEQLIKTLTSVIFFLIFINAYPVMIQGINRIIYAWSYGSTYGKVAAMIQKTTSDGEATEFWEKKANDPDAYSDIIKVLEEETGKGNVAKKYILDIFDKGSDKRPGMFIRPNAVMRLLMLTFENIWYQAIQCLENVAIVFYLPKDPAGFVLLTLSAFAVLLGGIFCSIQYFIGAIEFTLITSVGCIMLPFMLWDGTKFLTEKLVGAIVGQALKLLFVTLTFMLAINGFLALMVRPFDNFIDQTIYTLFTIFLHWLLCQNGPALATALLTGTPQLSMAEGLRTAASMAGAAAAGGAAVKGAASAGVKTAVQGKAAVDQAVGAGKAAAADGKGKLGSIAAGARSMGDSAKESVKSGVHGLAKSLTNGKGGGGNNSGGGNRFSSLEARNKPKEDGNRKTSGEFAQENKAKGAERYAQHKQETKNAESSAWKAQIGGMQKPVQQDTKKYDGGTPLGQQSPQRTTPPTPPSGGNNGKSS